MDEEEKYRQAPTWRRGEGMIQSGQGEPMLVSAAAKLWGKVAHLCVLVLLGFKGLKGENLALLMRCLSSSELQHLNSKTGEGQTESKLFYRVFHSGPASAPAFP